MAIHKITADDDWFDEQEPFSQLLVQLILVGDPQKLLHHNSVL